MPRKFRKTYTTREILLMERILGYENYISQTILDCNSLTPEDRLSLEKQIRINNIIIYTPWEVKER